MLFQLRIFVDTSTKAHHTMKAETKIEEYNHIIYFFLFTRSIHPSYSQINFLYREK
jgi:hypothetical protein